LHRSSLGRGLITLASTFLACAAAYGVALADTPTPASADTPTPVAVTSPAPHERPAPFTPPQGRFTWQITPMQTYFTGSNLNTKQYGTVANRLAWQLAYSFMPRTSVYWNRTPNDSFQEMVNGAKNSPALDLIDEIGMSYRLERNWTIGVESYRRWRQCCPGAGDPTNANPAWESGWSVITNYAAGPNTIIGKPLSITYQGIEFNHPYTNAPAIASGVKLIGVSNEGTKYTSSETVLLRIPVYHQRKFVPFVNYQVLPTYFYSQVEPLYSNAVNYGANIVGSKLVTYTFSIRNLNERQEGYTFPSPNVQHYTWLIVAANFHGSLF